MNLPSCHCDFTIVTTRLLLNEDASWNKLLVIGRLFGADNRPKHYRCTSNFDRLLHGRHWQRPLWDQNTTIGSFTYSHSSTVSPWVGKKLSRPKVFAGQKLVFFPRVGKKLVVIVFPQKAKLGMLFYNVTVAGVAFHCQFSWSWNLTYAKWCKMWCNSQYKYYIEMVKCTAYSGIYFAIFPTVLKCDHMKWMSIRGRAWA